MPLNVLISSAGRRVGLLCCFREALSALNTSGRVLAIDATEYSSAGHVADGFYVVPKCTEPGFIEAVMDICEQEHVALVVPTIDTELPIYAAARKDFERIGCTVAISSPEAIETCQDKFLTNQWLTSNGFPAPMQTTVDEVLRRPADWQPPLILKPANGSASVGVRRIDSLDELAAAARGRDRLIVQEFIAGSEHTVNVYVNRQGHCVTAVPHRRLEIRAGEVSKAITTRNEAMVELITRVVEALPGAYGPLNVQCFTTAGDEIRIIEANARFGGGYPLAHRAGAHMTQWLLEEVIGLEPRRLSCDWEDGIVMLRYDEAIFLSSSRTRQREHTAALRRV